MSKGLGQKIAIQFSEKLTGDVVGLNPPNLASLGYTTPEGIITQSNAYSSSYYFSKCFDKDITSLWYTRLSGTQWGQIQLVEPIFISGFRWYVGDSYRPNGFTLEASNDGINWETLFTGNSANSTGWKTFTFPVTSIAYSYYRWSITSRYSSYLFLFEIELLAVIGNRKAFNVSGQEYMYVNGPLISKTYEITNLERHPNILDDKHLLLTFHPQGRFNNAEGNISVTYDMSIGNLLGRGGAVETFVQEFLPTDLIPFPSPNDKEHITVTATALTAFSKVDYRNRYVEDHIIVSGNATINFEYVGVINP